MSRSQNDDTADEAANQKQKPPVLEKTAIVEGTPVQIAQAMARLNGRLVGSQYRPVYFPQDMAVGVNYGYWVVGKLSPGSLYADHYELPAESVENTGFYIRHTAGWKLHDEGSFQYPEIMNYQGMLFLDSLPRERTRIRFRYEEQAWDYVRDLWEQLLSELQLLPQPLATVSSPKKTLPESTPSTNEYSQTPSLAHTKGGSPVPDAARQDGQAPGEADKGQLVEQSGPNPSELELLREELSSRPGRKGAPLKYRVAVVLAYRWAKEKSMTQPAFCEFIPSPTDPEEKSLARSTLRKWCRDEHVLLEIDGWKRKLGEEKFNQECRKFYERLIGGAGMPHT